jgi:4-hydroxybenzoate polyprenyltransferase
MSERTVPSQVRLKPDPTNVRAYFDLARPFTLVAPALGFISGALIAAGAFPREPWNLSLLTAPILGSLMAAVLNAGNNALNQIYDLEIDRVNKPKRPLPSGRLTIEQAWLFTAITYALALILAWLVAPGGRHECFWLVVIAVVCTFLLLSDAPAAGGMGRGGKPHVLGAYVSNDVRRPDWIRGRLPVVG